MKLTTLGLDLAKAVFQVHGADERGRTVLKKQLKRAQVLDFFANLTPCKIGMEACGSAHHWARKLMAMGHEVVLIPPQYVKPFVKRNKNDDADAEATIYDFQWPNAVFLCAATSEKSAPMAKLKPARHARFARGGDDEVRVA